MTMAHWRCDGMEELNKPGANLILWDDEEKWPQEHYRTGLI